MKSFWVAARHFDRNIRLYLLYWSMIAFSYFGVQGVLLNIYLVRLGYGPEFIGQLLASGMLIWGLFALPAGFLGARYGIKQAMIAALLILALGTGAISAAGALSPAVRPVVLVAAWMFTWVGAALGTVNGTPYLMSITTEANRGFAFSAQQAVMSAAGFAGSLSAGVLPGVLAGVLRVTLDDPGPYQFSLLLSPIAYLVAAAAFTRARSVTTVSHAAGHAANDKAPLGLFLFFGLIVFLQSFAEGIVRPFFNLYLDLSLNIPVAQIGSVLGISSLLLVLISLTTPAVLKRWGSGGAMRLTSLGFAVVTLLLAVLQQWPLAALVFFGISSMLTIMATARGIYSQEIVQPRWRTTTSAISTVGLALGWALSAWVGGGLIESAGFQTLFIIGALFSLTAGALLFLKKGAAVSAAQEDSSEVGLPAVAAAGNAEEQ